MSRWFSITSDALNDPAVQKLSGEDFRAAFVGALLGEQTPFSPFVTGPYIRPLAAEWSEIRSRIFVRDDYTCGYCGKRGGQLECDHIIPVARCGHHSDSNLVTACVRCNRSKRDKLLHEWRPA